MRLPLLGTPGTKYTENLALGITGCAAKENTAAQPVARLGGTLCDKSIRFRR